MPFRKRPSPQPTSPWPLDLAEMARGLRAIADGLDAGDDDAIVLVDNAELHPVNIRAYLNRTSR